MKIIKNNKYIIIGIILGIIGSISAYAITVSSRSVSFDKTGITGATKDNVGDALDELYIKAYTYPIYLYGKHVTFSSSIINILKGGTTQVTITPDPGYYISSASCTDGYTITNLITNKSVKTSQTVTINNNNKTKQSTCTVIAKTILPPKISSCPGCVYAFPTGTWQYSSNGGTEVTSEVHNDYRNLAKSIGKSYFIGMILNNNKIIRAFACGIEDDIPFCIEANKTNHSNNITLLNSIFGDKCYNATLVTYCLGSSVGGSTDASMYGSVTTYYGSNQCEIKGTTDEVGTISCK